MHNQVKTQKFKHLMLAMGPRDLNSAPYSPVHCSSHSMTSFQSSELTEVPVVENSQLFAQRVHSARTARGTPPLPARSKPHGEMDTTGQTCVSSHATHIRVGPACCRENNDVCDKGALMHAQPPPCQVLRRAQILSLAIIFGFKPRRDRVEDRLCVVTGGRLRLRLQGGGGGRALHHTPRGDPVGGCGAASHCYGPHALRTHPPSWRKPDVCSSS